MQKFYSPAQQTHVVQGQTGNIVNLDVIIGNQDVPGVLWMSGATDVFVYVSVHDWSSRSCQRQGDQKPCASFGCCQLYLSTQYICNQGVHNMQAQSAATGAHAGCKKRLKNVISDFVCDPRDIITETQQNFISVQATDFQQQLSTTACSAAMRKLLCRIGVNSRIGNQIADNLIQRARKTVHMNVSRNIQRQLQVLFAQARRQCLCQLLQRFGQIKIPPSLTGLIHGNMFEAADQFSGALDILFNHAGAFAGDTDKI